jgi:hypothetical protein
VDDAAGKRYLLLREPLWVAIAVPALVRSPEERGEMGEARDLAYYARPRGGVLPHRLELGVVERSFLLQDRVGDREERGGWG